MWANGLLCIPKPVAAQPQGSWAVYEFIEGTRLSASDVTAADINQAVKFLSQLKELRHNEDSGKIGPAAEACFSVQAIFDSIDLRLARLLSLEKTSPQDSVLHSFLEAEFSPILENALRRTLADSHGPLASDISPEERTLSPSDFGFHNALRRPNGELVFLDFEYFGWDDPAKMIADFLLHPAIQLSSSHMDEFLSETLKSFPEYPALTKRLKLVQPLFALKWTLILLNEFVPERLERRSFAGDDRIDLNQLQLQQLEKARLMLQRAAFDNEPPT